MIHDEILSYDLMPDTYMYIMMLGVWISPGGLYCPDVEA